MNVNVYKGQAMCISEKTESNMIGVEEIVVNLIFLVIAKARVTVKWILLL